MPDENYSKWANPDGVEDTSTNPEIQAKEEFVKQKTEDEWRTEAQQAGKDVMEYLNEQYSANQQAAGGEGGTGGTGGEEFTPNPLWNELQTQEGFTMPENLTAENEAELLKKALIDGGLAEESQQQQQQQQQQTPEITDPDVLALMRYKELNPEATLDDYVQQRTQYSDMLSMNDRDFMVAHLTNEYGLYDEEKNPDGLTEDQINDTVDAMEDNKTLLLEARKLKREYRSKSSSVTNITDEQVQQAQAQRRENNVKSIKEDVKKLFAETEKITELNGVNLSKAEITDINNAFEKAVLPDEQGVPPIMKMLQSDRVLWNFFAVNYLGDEKFKSALFNAGDATKEDLMNRLGLKPVVEGGRQTATGKKNVITPGLWSEPDPNDV